MPTAVPVWLFLSTCVNHEAQPLKKKVARLCFASGNDNMYTLKAMVITRLSAGKLSDYLKSVNLLFQLLSAPNGAHLYSLETIQGFYKKIGKKRHKVQPLCSLKSLNCCVLIIDKDRKRRYNEIKKESAPTPSFSPTSIPSNPSQ